MNQAFDSNQRIYSFQFVSDFLQTFYRYKKEENPRWSFGAWAQKMGAPKSTVVRNVKGTMPVNEAMEKAYRKFFGLNQDAQKYFSTIVAFEKIKRAYPDFSIQMPDMSKSRGGKFHLKIPEFTRDQTMEFLSRVDVWWLASLVGENGIAESEVDQLQARFHPGLNHIDMGSLAKECVDRGLFKRNAGRLEFDSTAVNYLGMTVVGVETTFKRYQQIFRNLQLMLEADPSNIPFENRACTYKCNLRDFPAMVQKCSAHAKEMMSTFSDEAGDTLVDLQIFLTPVVRPPESSIPFSKKSEAGALMDAELGSAARRAGNDLW